MIRAAVVLFLSLSLAQGVVRADEPAAPDAAELELIRKGVAARERGDDAGAAEIFRNAWERFGTPRARAQLGLAEQALGQWAAAEADLAAALATPHPWIAANRTTLESALSVIRQRLGSLDVVTNVAGSEVYVDGTLVGRTPLDRAARVPVGTVMVKVSAPGHRAMERTVTVNAGQLSRERFVLYPVELASPEPRFAPPQVTLVDAPAKLEPAKKPLPPWVFYTGVAATAVLTGLTVWSGLDVLDANEAYERTPTRAGLDDGRDRERRTNWLLGGAILLGVSTGAVGLYATDWSGR